MSMTARPSMVDRNVSRVRRAGMVLAAATVALGWMQTSSTAAATRSTDDGEAVAATMRLAFTEGPGEFRVRRVYACSEDCVVHPEDEPTAHVHLGKYTAVANKPDADGNWVLAVPEGSYFVALELQKPDGYGAVGYIKAAEPTPRLTEAEDEALYPLVSGDVDLGTFTLFSTHDQPVPGKLGQGSMHIFNDAYFFTEIHGRNFPRGTRVSTSWELCNGETRRRTAKVSKKGTFSYAVEAKLPGIARMFSWKTTATHRKYADLVQTHRVEFPKEFKTGC